MGVMINLINTALEPRYFNPLLPELFFFVVFREIA